MLLGSQKINDSVSVDDRTQVCCFSVFLFLIIISLNFIELKSPLFFPVLKLLHPNCSTPPHRDGVYTLMLIKLLRYECEVINMLALIACRESGGLLS